jgi:tetrapyrrole methylase family protein/MazG family protein
MPHANKPSPESLQSEFQRLIDLMHRLRAPGGCPWDAEQTHASLKRYVVEEAYEVLEAIERGVDEDLCDELGDLLLQVIFHAELASERSAFTITDVIEALRDKLVRRHPHVFGDTAVDGAAEVVANWNRIKAAEKSRAGTSLSASLASVPRGLPALLRAQRIGEETMHWGFDWSTASDVRDKLSEELAELTEACEHGQRELITAEIGDVLFTTVSLARHLRVDAEMALQEALERFRRRVDGLEQELERNGTTLRNASRTEVDRAWDAAKQRA